MPPGTDGSSELDERRRVLWLALAFGVISVPWTYGFELVPGLPLWPSFIASAAFFAAGSDRRGLGLSLGALLVGATYALMTLGIQAAFGGSMAALSLTVGVFMLLASLHPLVDVLAFAPGAFLGYATLFSVHEAGITLWVAGLLGQGLATAASMVIGAGLGMGAHVLSVRASGNTAEA